MSADVLKHPVLVALERTTQSISRFEQAVTAEVETLRKENADLKAQIAILAERTEAEILIEGMTDRLTAVFEKQSEILVPIKRAVKRCTGCQLIRWGKTETPCERCGAAFEPFEIHRSEVLDESLQNAPARQVAAIIVSYATGERVVMLSCVQCENEKADCDCGRGTW